MRRAVVGLVSVGAALLVASPILFVALGEGLVIYPNPGICRTETIWASLVPSIVALVLGLSALATEWPLNRKHSHATETPQ